MSVRIPRSSCLMGTLLTEGSSSRIVFLSMVVFKFSVQLGYYTVPGQLREYVYFSCPHTGIKQQLHSFIHTWVGWLCRKVDIHRDIVYLLHHIDTHINKRNNLKEGLQGWNGISASFQYYLMKYTVWVVVAIESMSGSWGQPLLISMHRILLDISMRTYVLWKPVWRLDLTV